MNPYIVEKYIVIYTRDNGTECAYADIQTCAEDAERTAMFLSNMTRNHVRAIRISDGMRLCAYSDGIMFERNDNAFLDADSYLSYADELERAFSPRVRVENVPQSFTVSSASSASSAHIPDSLRDAIMEWIMNGEDVRDAIVGIAEDAVRDVAEDIAEDAVRDALCDVDIDADASASTDVSLSVLIETGRKYARPSVPAEDEISAMERDINTRYGNTAEDAQCGTSSASSASCGTTLRECYVPAERLSAHEDDFLRRNGYLDDAHVPFGFMRTTSLASRIMFSAEDIRVCVRNRDDVSDDVRESVVRICTKIHEDAVSSLSHVTYQSTIYWYGRIAYVVMHSPASSHVRTSVQYAVDVIVSRLRDAQNGLDI